MAPNIPTTLAAAGGRGSAVDHRTLRQLCRHDRPLDLQGPGRDLQPAVRGERRQSRGEGQDRRRPHREPTDADATYDAHKKAEGPPTFWHKGNVGGPQRRDDKSPLGANATHRYPFSASGSLSCCRSGPPASRFDWCGATCCSRHLGAVRSRSPAACVGNRCR